LGYIILRSNNPITKIPSIKSWSLSKSVTQLRSFLGLTGYYSRFIQHYSHICRSLHDLLKRDGFQWTSHDTTAFNTLKDKLSATPVMALPNFQLPFTLETDASAPGLGVVLMQQGRPIAFFSQALVPKTSAQSTYHKEALAILLALKRWRHYLLGSQLIIKTDQQSLRYKLTQRLAEGIKHNLLMKLLDFNYTTDYKKGAENRVVDALSRKDNEILVISSTTPAWISNIENNYIHDTHFSSILEQAIVNAEALPNYSFHAGILRYKGKICIGNDVELRNKILSSLHSSVIGGHSGIRATYHRIKKIFYWPNPKKIVKTFVL
jgi:hypothetical protein